MVPDPDSKVFSVEPALAGTPWARASRPLDRVLGLTRLQAHYDTRPARCRGLDFFDWALTSFDTALEIDPREVERIPATGPAVVVANHPFGGIEGIALGKILGARRDDVRILANYMLGRIPEIRDFFFLVDPFEGPDSVRNNLGAVRQALAWLAGGGVLAVFPAGEVAHYDPNLGRVADPPWNPVIAKIARRAKCPVVPIHFVGRNRVPFHLAGLVHPRLRTALLGRELLGRSGRPIEVRIGRPISPARISGFAGDDDAIRYLRERTDILAERPRAGAPPVQPRRTPDTAVPLVAEVSPERLEQEIAALPADSLLVPGEDQEVRVAAAGSIPAVLHEIGRLRELTFREVGEGTGRAIDLDEFDAHYLHLFVWSKNDRKIVGAYRLGLTDRLLEASGIEGLYTSTLFRYKRKLFEEMGTAVEMGRSFVRPEYQKSYQGLMLLWKGIGEFVARHPRYATLFGPVSISADYHTASQRLIVSFLEKNRFAHAWSEWVRPRTPPRPDRRAGRRTRLLELRDLDDVSAFIAEIESDQKGVPILLKQYLKLGGRLLGFNVDPQFSNVLDVLIVVDLRHTERKILNRYMGRDGAGRFLAAVGPGTPTSRAG